jgi:hypothetical protein
MDSSCTVASTLTDIFLLASGGSYELEFATDTSTVEQEVYLCVENNVHATQFVKFVYLTCGLEELSLSSTSAYLIKSFTINSGV